MNWVEIKDLFALVTESFVSARHIAGFTWWLLAAIAAGVGSILASAFFCQMWNRRIEVTFWHRVLFGITALGAIVTILVFPATGNMEQAIRERLAKWQNSLSAQVPVDPKWQQEHLDSTVPWRGETSLPWFDGMAYRSRLNLKAKHFSQSPIVVTSPGNIAVTFVSSPEARQERSRFEVDAMLTQFDVINPCFAGRFGITPAVKKHCIEVVSNLRGDRTYGRLANILQQTLMGHIEPAIPKVAGTFRIAAILMLLGMIVLPSIISGLISYSQVRTGHAGRLPRPVRQDRSLERARRRRV